MISIKIESIGDGGYAVKFCNSYKLHFATYYQDEGWKLYI